jgi:hypothetical protein
MNGERVTDMDRFGGWEAYLTRAIAIARIITEMTW